jgi:hypothetical protein
MNNTFQFLLLAIYRIPPFGMRGRLFFVTFFLCTMGYSQQLQWQWAIQGTGIHSESVCGMACDSVGNVYVSGHFSDSLQFGETVLHSQGKRDIFLVKFDKNGTILWAKSAGGAGDDYPSAIAISANDAFYLAGIVGEESLFDNVTVKAQKSFNLFVAYYSSEAEAVWANTFSARPSDYITSLSIDTTGNGYFVGYFEKTLHFDEQHTIVSAGKTDAFAVCLNSAGKIQWANRWGGKG